MKNCKFCDSINLVHNGKVRKRQRYLCKDCGKVQISGDRRMVHDDEAKRLALILYLEGNGFRRIARILNHVFKKSFISFQIVNYWINSAGNFVRQESERRKEREFLSRGHKKEALAVVELDELYTYIKKNLVRTGKPESKSEITPGYGLLLIGNQVIYLNLK
jgi:transposase-like protein